MTTSHLTRTRRSAAALAAALSLGVLSACGNSGGDDVVPADQVEELSEQLGTLDDRVTDLESGFADMETAEGPMEDEPADEGAAILADPREHVGEEVTVTAEISQLYDTTDAGSVFRIAGDVGEQVAVVSTDPPEQLLANDVVQVTGTVMLVDEPEFEEKFGIAADELFEEADNFFADVDGEAAIVADSVELVEGGSGN